MDGTVIDLAINKLQWLFDHPEVTWSGSGIYALSLTGSAVLVIASCVFRRKKKSSVSNKFNCNGGEQNIAQGDHAIGKQINNYGVSPELFAQYVSELGVTDSALASFFKILEEQQVARGDLDSKLREIAFRHKELLLRFEAVQSDDPEVRSLKVQAKDAIEDGRFAEAENLLAQARERDREAVSRMKASIAEQQAALEKRQLSEAASCAEQADLQRLQYRYDKSAQYYQEAATVLPEGRKAKRADYLSAAGYNLKQITRYSEALSLYEQSLSISREIGDRKGEGILLNNISQIYKIQGDYGNTLQYLEQSLLICREVGNKRVEGITLNNIAMTYLTKGDDPKALQYIEQSLALLREIHDKAGKGWSLNNIGMIHYTRGNYAAALEYYTKALPIAREIKDKATESKVLNNISQVYRAQGKLDAALEYSEQDLAITRQIGDRQGEGITLNNIAAIYEEKGDYPAALKQCEQALVIAQEIGDKDGDAVTCGNIGLLYEKQGELTKAEPYLSRAVDLAKQLEHPKLEEWREALQEVRAKLREQG